MKANHLHNWAAMPDWITTEEAAQISGYHVNYIRRLMRGNKIAGRKAGTMWWVDSEGLREYLVRVEALGNRRYGPGGVNKLPRK